MGLSGLLVVRRNRWTPGLLVVRRNRWTPGLLVVRRNRWTPGLLLLRLDEWTSLLSWVTKNVWSTYLASLLASCGCGRIDNSMAPAPRPGQTGGLGGRTPPCAPPRGTATAFKDAEWKTLFQDDLTVNRYCTYRYPQPQPLLGANKFKSLTVTHSRASFPLTPQALAGCMGVWGKASQLTMRVWLSNMLLRMWL